MTGVDPLLKVQDLHVHFTTYGGVIKAVRGVSFAVRRGEAVAIVGESGCGKSVTAQAIMGLIPSPPGRIAAGSIQFDGRDIVQLPERELQRIRGWEIGMIFQDPMTSLNPTMTIGNQIMEGLLKHQGLGRAEARARALEMLGTVGIPRPTERLDAFPHQFSGGMRQRVVIAMALACNPKLLIADEPTTALDVTIQAQILEVMKDLKKQFDTAIILITHDLGVVAGLAERVVVMYAGQVAEQGTVDEIFSRPRHPYTWGLLRSVPRLDATARRRLVAIPGTPPDLFAPPSGCAFAARCDYAMRVCHLYPPDRVALGEQHEVACWLEHPLAARDGLPVGGAAE